MRRMAIRTTDVISPMLAAPEVVVLFPARVAAKACLGDFLRPFVLKGDDLRRVPFFHVGLAGSVTSLAAGRLSFPAA